MGEEKIQMTFPVKANARFKYIHGAFDHEMFKVILRYQAKMMHLRFSATLYLKKKRGKWTKNLPQEQVFSVRKVLLSVKCSRLRLL